MSDTASTSESRHLRKEISRLQAYIEDQRRRHSLDLKALEKELQNEITYSERLRRDLDKESKRCKKLRKDLDQNKRLAKDLREDLDDERNYSEQLERKLDKRTRYAEKLKTALFRLEDEYQSAYRDRKRIDTLEKELNVARRLEIHTTQKYSQLKEQVRTLRAKESSTTMQSSSTMQTYVAAAPPSFKLAPVPEDDVRPQTPLNESGSEYSDADGPDDEFFETGAQDRQVPHDEVYYPEDVEPPVDELDEEGNEEYDRELPGSKLRSMAAREGRLAERELQRARVAYSSGDKAFAKKLKDTALRHREAQANYHRLAAAEIFNSHNPEYYTRPNSRTKIDLHHLHVNEAREFVEQHIVLCREQGVRACEVICGRGNHSVDGVARLKPAVLEYLATVRDIIVDTQDKNPGRLLVRFGGGGGSANGVGGLGGVLPAAAASAEQAPMMDHDHQGATTAHHAHLTRHGLGHSHGHGHGHNPMGESVSRNGSANSRGSAASRAATATTSSSVTALEYDEVFSEGSGGGGQPPSRLRSAMRAAPDGRQGLEYIEQGMRTMKIRPSEGR